MKSASTTALCALFTPLLVVWAAGLASSPGSQEAPDSREPSGSESSGEARKPVTVFLVRHAETAESTLTQRDPALSAEGTQRARDLARLLSKAGVTHLFASEYARTGSTLAPLAAAAGLEVEVIAAREQGRQVEALRALAPGSIAVVCGHSNTVPGLVAALGGQARELAGDPRSGPTLPHDAYDRLFVLTLPAGEGALAQSIELRFGT